MLECTTLDLNFCLSNSCTYIYVYNLSMSQVDELDGRRAHAIWNELYTCIGKESSTIDSSV